MGRKKKDATKEGNIKGFDISINEFGEIVTSLPIERLNDFLNKKEAAESEETADNDKKKTDKPKGKE
jgi:hypothetical protein